MPGFEVGSHPTTFGFTPSGLRSCVSFLVAFASFCFSAPAKGFRWVDSLRFSASLGCSASRRKVRAGFTLGFRFRV